ncbi:DUF421 domain-containing protein [Paenibacillus sp. sgz302251]|uniref:DUF421 domain-containing protein n=1 Tax=Paenibacillus sp. sgz302251 TaxID=3414493 RepID=UPI003C7E3DCD
MPEWLEVVLRTLFSVIVLFAVTKMLGKRQISQLSLFEYITGITIGSLAAYISLEIDSTWYLGVISLVVWAGISLGIELLQLKSKKARDLIDGTSTVLIKDGKVMEDNLKKERLTNEDLLEELRSKNIFKIADVEFAIIETDGRFNVLPTRENQPMTPKHYGIKVSPEQEPQTVILDGRIMDEPLATIGLNRSWLNVELEKLGVAVENVYVGQVDAYKQLYVDLFDDQLIVPVPQKKATLYTTLKKCEADLELFGLTTNNKQAKKMYEQCANHLQNIITELKPILHR